MTTAVPPRFNLPGLLQPVESLHGVGPRLGKLLTRLCGPRMADVALHLPVSVTDRRNVVTIAAAQAGQLVTLSGTVSKVEMPKKRGRPWHISLRDQTGELQLAYFNVATTAQTNWLQQFYRVGQNLAVSGRIEFYEGKKQIIHPDHAVPAAHLPKIAVLEPNYPLTAGLSAKVLRKAIQQAIANTESLPEWADNALLRQQAWPSFGAALQQLHNPTALEDILPPSPWRTRLAYDEMLANQLALAIVRNNTRVKRGKARPVNQTLRQQVLRSLPWQLTAAQQRVLAEIDADMAAPVRMVRLLQGDVGSGKTIIAFLAMLNAVAAGEQAALMAPTEILAQQHLATLQPLAQAVGLKIALLTGALKGSARRQVLAAIASGEADIVLGTHALFQQKVSFAKLGFVAIDEQHRFGVEQRVALAQKGTTGGDGLDMLVMTATPIPRSLALTYYGDMDVSKLDEKPPGRQAIKTSTLDLKYLADVIERVRVKIAAGERIYWVCPLIEESDLQDLAAATERARLLGEQLGQAKIGLMHGRLTPAEKQQVMADFMSGKTPVLVATTVIEVGVNVPEATVMIIDHAERFGLAQLHQLRGRVGRGSKASACLLLYQGPLGETARARLKMMVATDDGFVLAEEDLRLRGAGEVLGTKQSGAADFKIADLSVHQSLLLTARDEAKYILHLDPQLQSERGQALRLLLRLFNMDHSVRYLDAG